MNDSIQNSLFELESELQKLKTATTYMEGAQKAVESAESVLNITRDLQQNFNRLKTATEELTGRIMKVDFPVRLDKIDTNISTVNLNISNILSRFEATEKSLKDNIDSMTNSINMEIKDSSSAVNKILVDHASNLNGLRDGIERKAEVIKIVLENQRRELRILKVAIILTVILIISIVIRVFS